MTPTTETTVDGLIHKVLRHGDVISKAHGAATAADLVLINSFAREPLTADEVFVAEAVVASDAVDSDGERIATGLLEKFARQLPGRFLQLDHVKTGRGKGRFFRAGVQKDAAGTGWLEGAFYVPRRPHHADLISDLTDGLVNDVSIGFRAKRVISKAAGAGSSGRDPVVEYQDDAAGRAMILEVSLVYAGAIPGARVKGMADDELGAPDEIELLGGVFKVSGGIPSDFRASLKAVEREVRTARAIQDELGIETIEEARQLKVLAECGKMELHALKEHAVKLRTIEGTLSGPGETAAYRQMLSRVDREGIVKEIEGLRRKMPKTDVLDAMAEPGKGSAGSGRELPLLASRFTS